MQPAADTTSTGEPWALIGTMTALAAFGCGAYWVQRRRTSVQSGPPETEI
ncbi:MAG: hypothetical protein H0U22_15510 [Geodermatophilaceae bacterium]|nr:hypothetical protein [Geodermatophilaceae bacterium]